MGGDSFFISMAASLSSPQLSPLYHDASVKMKSHNLSCIYRSICMVRHGLMHLCAALPEPSVNINQGHIDFILEPGESL